MSDKLAVQVHERCFSFSKNTSGFLVCRSFSLLFACVLTFFRYARWPLLVWRCAPAELEAEPARFVAVWDADDDSYLFSVHKTNLRVWSLKVQNTTVVALVAQTIARRRAGFYFAIESVSAGVCACACVFVTRRLRR